MSFTVEQFAELARRVGHVTIATSDAQGVPHIASAKGVATRGEYVIVSEWFCPGTVANLQENHNVSIVAWDEKTDEGLQLIGLVEKVEDFAIMDGHLPEAESLPQVQRRLTVAPERILRFSHVPHTDMP